MSTTPEYTKDTIAAAATPPGIGGVGVVRISGAEAKLIASAVVKELPAPRQASLRDFKNSKGLLIDQGLVIYFPAPNTFTGEDVVELHGHGGPVVIDLIVDALIQAGARRAEPGEFSKRAFLNERLDLAQAEAIADLIGSGTRQAALAAARSLSGVFSEAVIDLQERLTLLRLHTEAALDFPEEEIDFLSDEALLQRVDDCQGAFDEIAAAASAGRLLRDGFQIAIVGKPNAGKSSLLNQLSGHDAAIVTEVAGTTRDILRERIDIDGLAVELVDTAGLREDPGVVEAEGIRRAHACIASADAILLINDSSDHDQVNAGDLLPDLDDDKPVLTVNNKIDLSGADSGRQGDHCNISAKTGDGIDALKAQIRDIAGYQDQGEGALTARRRHLRALKEAREHFDAGRIALQEKKAGELFAEELRLAQQSLGEITGEFSSDDLLGRIFSEFCIGK